eukprot:g4120.t1
MESIGEDMVESDHKKEELGGLDLETAKLDDMSQALGSLECDKRDLLENIRVLRVRLADEKEDQSDVYYYLHKKLDDNYDVISALERQLMVETADREKAETEYARQIEELETRRDEELGPLKDKLLTEEEQLNGMHEAAKNKREADANRARLEAEIKMTESTVENDLNNERRKKLQEKQRVRRQVEDEIKQLTSELFSKKEIELADKTVRAKDNNEKLHAALQAKAKQAERMMVANQGLALENRSLRNDVDLATASEVVLEKHVRLYHDLVVSLKARLEKEACDAEEDTSEEQALAELEESLASGGGGSSGGERFPGDKTVSALDTMSLTSDTPPGAQVIWAGGACGALAYESVDELRVAVESLQRLHAELQQEAKTLAARIEESRAADAAVKTARSGAGGDDGDPVVSCLLNAAEAWVVRSRAAAHGEQKAPGRGGGSGSSSSASLLLALPASAAGQLDTGGGKRGSLPSGRSGRKARGSSSRSSSDSTRGKAAGERVGTASGRRGTTAPEEQDHPSDPQQAATSVGGEGSGGGTLAAATTTLPRRRELFYHLVDAFRDYQTRGGTQQSSTTVSGGGAGVDEEGLANCEKQAEGNGGGGGLPPIGGSCGGGGGSGDDFAGASASDNFSVSVRTLCDFGPLERRNASTQTIAKHFPDKFVSVRPARRLVVNSTFLTSNSTVTNSVFSASTARSNWGYGAVPLDS